MSEEKPPFYRFVNASEEDRVATEQAGIPQYKDVVYVYIRQPGENKTEHKDYARDVKYEIFETLEKVPEMVTVFDDVLKEQVEKQAFVEKKVQHRKKKIVFPRLEKLREWVKNGHKSPALLEDYEKRWNAFLDNEDLPVEGTPLADWRGAPEAVKRRTLEIGLNTVEQVAEMDDATIQVIGMGARDMRTRAQAYLEQDLNPIINSSRMKQLEEQLKVLQEQVGQKTEDVETALEDKTDDELIEICRRVPSGAMATKSWKRETLLRKAREVLSEQVEEAA